MQLGGPSIAAALLCAAPAAAASDPICADRPGKGTATCTVPAGHWQIETGLIDWTGDRQDGVRSDVTVLGASYIKLGISNRADIELGITPLQILRVRGEGVRERASEFGDMVVRAKYRLTADNSPVEIALDPFVKIPTAGHRLGNGKVEAGVAVPIGAALGSKGITLSATPEIDWRADADGRGRHAAMIQVAGLGFSPSERLTLSAELWGEWDWDPDGTGKQVSADGAVAFLAGDRVQLDAGANFGLNRQTPDVQLYVGMSKRF